MIDYIISNKNATRISDTAFKVDFQEFIAGDNTTKVACSQVVMQNTFLNFPEAQDIVVSVNGSEQRIEIPAGNYPNACALEKAMKGALAATTAGNMRYAWTFTQNPDNTVTIETFGNVVEFITREKVTGTITATAAEDYIVVFPVETGGGPLFSHQVSTVPLTLAELNQEISVVAVASGLPAADLFIMLSDGSLQVNPGLTALWGPTYLLSAAGTLPQHLGFKLTNDRLPVGTTTIGAVPFTLSPIAYQFYDLMGMRDLLQVRTPPLEFYVSVGTNETLTGTFSEFTKSRIVGLGYNLHRNGTSINDVKQDTAVIFKVDSDAGEYTQYDPNNLTYIPLHTDRTSIIFDIRDLSRDIQQVYTGNFWFKMKII